MTGSWHHAVYQWDSCNLVTPVRAGADLAAREREAEDRAKVVAVKSQAKVEQALRMKSHELVEQVNRDISERRRQAGALLCIERQGGRVA